MPSEEIAAAKRYVEILPTSAAGTRLRVERDAREDDMPLTELAIETVHPEQTHNPDANHIRRSTIIDLTDDEIGWMHDRIGEVRALVDQDFVTELQRTRAALEERRADVVRATGKISDLEVRLAIEGAGRDHAGHQIEVTKQAVADASAQVAKYAAAELEQMEERTVARISAWLRAMPTPLVDVFGIASCIERRDWKNGDPATWSPKIGDDVNAVENMPPSMRRSGTVPGSNRRGTVVGSKPGQRWVVAWHGSDVTECTAHEIQPVRASAPVSLLDYEARMDELLADAGLSPDARAAGLAALARDVRGTAWNDQASGLELARRIEGWVDRSADLVRGMDELASVGRIATRDR